MYWEVVGSRKGTDVGAQKKNDVRPPDFGLWSNHGRSKDKAVLEFIVRFIVPWKAFDHH
jgi:hypothetical protein